ncbi:hypothetical protein CTRC122_04070 [Chlamydia trachomatis RC-J(s)/122]|nr:hypothetical protein CTRC852_04165 [Chlamydia trachomatis RC-F(s)/852]AGR99784.1 hypothetical protein CTRC342_04150 [Chlamydia trachomatis RC-F(s)/342]AGS00720.1 hypothetical protein CTRC122_04070 [Chlamydia trachomatis RC-J(s)/122]AGS02602.1 hypothetical protein CTJTET1_04120 [Chlamydia trachomatis J/6276tet1]
MYLSLGLKRIRLTQEHGGINPFPGVKLSREKISF